MTINIADNNPRIVYSIAEGVTQTVFSVPFEFFDDSDFVVYVDGVAKSEGADYTIIGGDGSTGTITFVTATPPDAQQVTGAVGGSQVAIVRHIPIERTNDFVSGQDINRAALNTQLDEVVALVSDLNDKVDRTIHLNDYEVAPSMLLTSDRKGRVLAFNPSTGGVEAGPLSNDIQTIADNIVEILDVNNQASAASASANAASASAVAAAASETAASTSEDNAATSETNAGTSAANAATSATSAATSAASAAGSVTSALASETAAATSAINAATSETNAAASETSAATSAATATTKASEASTSATNAATSESNASTSATASAASAAAALSSETAAAASETAAAASEAAAASSESAAATSESNAATSATNAASSASSASTSATNAATSASNAANSETAAASSASAASVSETAAAASETAASASEVAAAASETAAAASEAAAAASASTATTKASEASTSATNAATSESNAATSASTAATSASAAEASKDAALAALDNFDDRYLGQKASDPTVDNDGDPLVAGALYFNTTDDVMKVYEGSVWVAAYASLSGALLQANNLSDLASASAGRTNLGLGTGDSPTFAGLTTTGNVSFGDNDKAIFGAGSDLQIYHDGAHSYVKDNGTGDLKLQGNNLYLQNASGETYLGATSDGSVFLRYDNATKLATTSTGIDVTGTVTADGLTVELPNNSGNTLFYGGSQSDRGLKVEVSNADGFDNSAWKINAIAPNSGSTLTFATRDSDRVKLASNGDISFYEDTGTTPKFFWDSSAESLKLGHATTTYGDNLLDLVGQGLGVRSGVAWMRSSTGDSVHQINVNGSRLEFGSGATLDTSPTMVLATSGNVGIGTSSPSSALHVQGGLSVATFESTSSSAFVTVANSGGSASISSNSNDLALITPTSSGGAIRFLPNSSEKMRIDSSGNLLVGTTSYVGNSSTNTGGGFGIDSTGSYLFSTRDNETPAFFNRLNGDGKIAEFRKDGSTVGSIGSYSSGLDIAGSIRGIRFSGATIFPVTNAGGVSDNSVQLGYSGGRFKDLYLSGGLRGDTTFKNNAGTTEYARIGSSGNLLVGKTTTAFGTQGIALRPVDGVSFTRSSGSALDLNRLSTEGEIIGLYKDSASVGSIGTVNGRPYIGLSDAALWFDNSNNRVVPYDTGTLAATNGTLDIGSGTQRFKDLYLSGTANAAAFVGDGSGLTNLPAAGLQASSSVSINQNTNYLNSLGRPVFVFASCYYATTNNRSLALQIDYGAGLVEVSRTTTTFNSSHTVCGVVPDGATYRVNGTTTNQTQFNAREFR